MGQSDSSFPHQQRSQVPPGFSTFPPVSRPAELRRIRAQEAMIRCLNSWAPKRSQDQRNRDTRTTPKKRPPFNSSPEVIFSKKRISLGIIRIQAFTGSLCSYKFNIIRSHPRRGGFKKNIMSVCPQSPWKTINSTRSFLKKTPLDFSKDSYNGIGDYSFSDRLDLQVFFKMLVINRECACETWMTVMEKCKAPTGSRIVNK